MARAKRTADDDVFVTVLSRDPDVVRRAVFAEIKALAHDIYIGLGGDKRDAGADLPASSWRIITNELDALEECRSLIGQVGFSRREFKRMAA